MIEEPPKRTAATVITWFQNGNGSTQSRQKSKTGGRRIRCTRKGFQWVQFEESESIIIQQDTVEGQHHHKDN